MTWLRRCVLSVILIACAARPGLATTPPLYVIAIGNNQPADMGATGVEVLQYADDDASAFFQFLAPFSRMARLLTVMDPDTQRRFPAEATLARAPTLAELRSIVEVIRRSIDQDRARGESPTVLFFYSGHGSRATSAAPFLAMLDGGLTRETLYDEILGVLPARYIHVFVDACYAEAVVRPRDADASPVQLDDEQVDHYATRSTLARFPNVGAIVSSTASSRSHEWDVYRHGVFTHELLSGLRGGADVNGDEKIEYSEVYAFLSAASREIEDSRARPSIVVRAPAENGRVPIVDLAQFRAGSRITSIPGTAGHVYFEDQTGNRLADIHADRGTVVSLTLPVDRLLYVHDSHGEGQIRLSRGESIAFDHISLGPPRNRERGSLDGAMRLGLFAAEFGPGYYRGFVDHSSDLVPVTFSPAPELAEPATGVSAALPPALGSRLGALVLALGAEAGVARPQALMPALRLGLRSSTGSGPGLDVDVGWRSGPGFNEGRALVSAGYRLAARWRGLGTWLGGTAGVGLAMEKANGAAWSYTGLAGVTPCLGALYMPAQRWGFTIEIAASGFLFEQEGALATRILPSAYTGIMATL